MSSMVADEPRTTLRALSRTMQDLHRQILELERNAHPGRPATEMLDRLINDPEWAWLRPVSQLIADIDHVDATTPDFTQHELEAVAGQIREMIYEQRDSPNDGFLARYRPLLQQSAALAAGHGELKRLLNAVPVETENESQRLHARHQWAMRCKHHNDS